MIFIDFIDFIWSQKMNHWVINQYISVDHFWIPCWEYLAMRISNRANSGRGLTLAGESSMALHLKV